MTEAQRHTSPSQRRRIAYRTRGHSQGPLTRLISPGDLGGLVKPFVFLDYFEFRGFKGDGGPVHPHSGIATHTTLLQGSLVYGDSTGKFGPLSSGSVDWMQAGGGVWHGGTPLHGQPLRGFQLWVALPPARELARAESHYVDNATIPGDGRVRVLFGAYREDNTRFVRSPCPKETTRMKDSKALLLEYLASIRDPEHAASLFARQYGPRVAAMEVGPSIDKPLLSHVLLASTGHKE
jgi:redox-sensitive bicupin YhaK (pirin superfamily)